MSDCCAPWARATQFARPVIAEEVSAAFRKVFDADLELVCEISHNRVQRTAKSARSMRRRDSSSDGKQLPVRSLGICNHRRPEPVSTPGFKFTTATSRRLQCREQVCDPSAIVTAYARLTSLQPAS
jgi:hypothetical protein